jgi:beta-lactamase class D
MKSPRIFALSAVLTFAVVNIAHADLSTKERVMPSAASMQARVEAFGQAALWRVGESVAQAEDYGAIERADQRAAPASTFKIVLALIALETGKLSSADEVIKWDGHSFPNRPEWQRDMQLGEAMRSSSEPYFRTLAARIGHAELEQWVGRLAYGNQRIGADPSTAWIDGVLQISPREQFGFIERLRRGELPIGSQHVATVRESLLILDGQTRVYGKTGTSAFTSDRPGIAWLVGWVEQPGQSSRSFVLQMNMRTMVDRTQRLKLSYELLGIDAGN